MSFLGKFSLEYLLDYLEISSEHEALEAPDRVETAMHVWRRKASQSHSRSPWSAVKDVMESDKNVMLASRAEDVLLCLKQCLPRPLADHARRQHAPAPSGRRRRSSRARALQVRHARRLPPGQGHLAVVQTCRPPPRLRDYAPTLVCCASRLFMLCVSWCDRQGPVNRREKVVRKLFELDLSSLQWTEASAHPDAPMDPHAAFAVGQDSVVYAVEMFRIFGKVLDFVTACRVSDTEQKWSRVGRENAATEADAMSCRLKSMAVLHL